MITHFRNNLSETTGRKEGKCNHAYTVTK